MTEFDPQICPVKYERNHPESPLFMSVTAGLGFDFAPLVPDLYDDQEQSRLSDPLGLDDDLSDSLCDGDCPGPAIQIKRTFHIFRREVEICRQGQNTAETPVNIREA